MVSLHLIPFSTHLGHTIAKIRSNPMLTPIHGSAGAFFPSAAAAAVNIPTKLSYRPPAAMEPTPTDDSSISSSSSSPPAVFLAGFFFGGNEASAMAGGDVDA